MALCEREQSAFNRSLDKVKSAINAKSQNDTNESELALELLTSGMPAAYRTGLTKFCGLEFMVGFNKTMIPRPASETLVNAALSIYYDIASRSQTCRVLDLGTGSGCLLLSFLSLCQPQSVIGYGIDLSSEAIDIARKNAEMHGLSENLYRFMVHDMFYLQDLTFSGPIDLIICNPPYLSTRFDSRIVDQLIRYEPELALVSGPTGYETYQCLNEAIISSSSLLSKNCYLILEVAKGRAEAVMKIFNDTFQLKSVNRDEYGFERCLVMQKKSNIEQG